MRCTPARPAAAMILPQLASSPKKAVFTSGELATVKATSAGAGVIEGPGYADFDQLGGPFAIHHQSVWLNPPAPLSALRQRAGSRGCPSRDNGIGRSAAGKNQQRIIGAGVPIDGDGIEGGLGSRTHPMFQNISSRSPRRCRRMPEVSPCSAQSSRRLWQPRRW